MTREQRTHGHTPSGFIVDEVLTKVEVRLDNTWVDITRSFRRGLTAKLVASRADLSHAWAPLGYLHGAAERCTRCRAIRHRDPHGLLCPGPHRIDIRSELLWP